MRILGIESSCDETAAAIVDDGQSLLSSVVQTQIPIHAEYGGVIPEIAARSHIEAINPVVRRALLEANCSWQDIDAIAVTYAPGLVGSLLVGSLAARTLAVVHDKPIYKIHHVEAHVYANFITKQLNTSFELPAATPDFPFLALIVSGGHSQLVLFRGHGDYQLIGQTQDDAVGEAFDKVAKILGLPYPGGPSIAEAATQGDPKRYQLPISRMSGAYDYSFSGLKTAVLRAVQRETGNDYTFPSHELAGLLTTEQRNDFAASFQNVAVRTLVGVTKKAFEAYQPKSVVIAGGVAANQELRRQLSLALPINIEYAPVQLCTDNAAMVASLAYYHTEKHQPDDSYTLEVTPSLSMNSTAWSNA